MAFSSAHHVAVCHRYFRTLNVRFLAWVEVLELVSPGTADRKARGGTRCASAY